MVNIKVPGQFMPELAYVIDIMLEESLQFTYYKLEYGDQQRIEISNGERTFIFPCIFFSGSIEKLYSREKLPQRKSTFTYKDQEYYTLYANGNQVVTSDKIEFNADIFGTAFCLLTQWESTLGCTDLLGRYDFERSIISAFDLYHTPVVNQYILLMKQILQELGEECKPLPYKVKFTCDVDSITKYKSLRNLVGAIYHRDRWAIICKEYISSKQNKRNDPYYSFTYLFDVLDKKKMDATFYFMAENQNRKYDTMDYDLKENAIQNIFLQLKERDFSIGLHPSIDTWLSSQSIADQKEKLEEHLGAPIIHTRQHYLRYKADTTFSILENVGFQFDSSMQFTQGLGFACGICTPFSMYDIKERRKLNLVQEPLIVMKKKNYVVDVEGEFDKMKIVLDQARKYDGRFSILFHNSDLETNNERRLFEEVIDYV